MKKRLHAFYKLLYDRWMMFWTRHPPKSFERLNVPTREEAWELDGTYCCIYCTWMPVKWDKKALGWQCPECGQRYHPYLPVTEKRAAVTVPTIWKPAQTTPIPRSISMPLPEQQAVQPSRISQGISYEQIEVFQPRQAQVFKKYHSGQLKLDANGKPIFTKTGVPVRTDQFKLLRIPTHDDHRRTG